MNSTNIRPLIGLLGVLVAALSADLNEFVSGAALIDYRGALGISADPGRWIDSLSLRTDLSMLVARRLENRPNRRRRYVSHL